MIGLDQIEVIKPRTNPEMYEPKYRCTLCCVTAEIDGILMTKTLKMHFFLKINQKSTMERAAAAIYKLDQLRTFWLELSPIISNFDFFADVTFSCD